MILIRSNYKPYNSDLTITTYISDEQTFHNTLLVSVKEMNYIVSNC